MDALKVSDECQIKHNSWLLRDMSLLGRVFLDISIQSIFMTKFNKSIFCGDIESITVCMRMLYGLIFSLDTSL